MDGKKVRIYKNGFHIYFGNVLITLAIAQKIKSYAERIVMSYYKKFNPINEPSDIIDNRVITRKNGLMLIGTFKKPRSGGQYMLKLKG